jgi:hypothetical protein
MYVSAISESQVEGLMVVFVKARAHAVRLTTGEYARALFRHYLVSFLVRHNCLLGSGRMLLRGLRAQHEEEGGAEQRNVLHEVNLLVHVAGGRVVHDGRDGCDEEHQHDTTAGVTTANDGQGTEHFEECCNSNCDLCSLVLVKPGRCAEVQETGSGHR